MLVSHKYTDEVICPHCGYEYQDSWEFSDYEDLECYECGKEFFITRHIDVTYCTEKKL